MANGSNLIAQPDEHYQMANEAGGSAQPDHQTQPDSVSEDIQLAEEQLERGNNMGKSLNMISRSRPTEMPLIIPEGNIRPEVPLSCCKVATECIITVKPCACA